MDTFRFLPQYKAVLSKPNDIAAHALVLQANPFQRALEGIIWQEVHGDSSQGTRSLIRDGCLIAPLQKLLNRGGGCRRGPYVVSLRELVSISKATCRFQQRRCGVLQWLADCTFLVHVLHMPNRMHHV